MSNKFLDDPTTFNNGNMIGPDGSASSRVLPNDDAIRDGIRESIVSTVISLSIQLKMTVALNLKT